MATYLLIDSTNTIQRILDWDGVAPFAFPAGVSIVQYNGLANEGWAWDGANAIDPVTHVPLPNNFLPMDTFLNRFTDAEYQAMKQAINTQIAAGNVKLIRFLDIAATRHGFDVTSAAATQLATATVTAGILTQARALVVFAKPA